MKHKDLLKDATFKEMMAKEVRYAKDLEKRYRVGTAAEYCEELLNIEFEKHGSSLIFFARQRALQEICKERNGNA